MPENTNTQAETEKGARESYKKVVDCLYSLVNACDQSMPPSEVATLAISLYKYCPSMRSPREWPIANECVPVELRSQLAGDYGVRLLDAIENGLAELADNGKDELVQGFDYAGWLVFFLGISETDFCDENVDLLLDRIDEWGSLQSSTSMLRDGDYNAFEAHGFFVLLTSDEVPDWARLNILLLDNSTLVPEERSEIAIGLSSADSFICNNLADICKDVAAKPYKYELRFINALLGFVSGDLSLSSQLLDADMGISLDEVHACRNAIMESALASASKYLAAM